MLHLHRAERTDALVAGLAELLAKPPLDAFDLDVVSVPTRGVERWLTQRLSHVLGTTTNDSSGQLLHTDGVCARVEFPSPAELTLRALGHDPDAEPWRPARLSWTLLSVLDEALALGAPWTAHLAGYLGANPTEAIDRGRRAALSLHLARLFDSYAASRPTMLAAWEAGEESSSDLPDDLAWQPPLWRAVAANIGTDNPATRLALACDQLSNNPDAVDLPARVSVFGPTRLATSDLLVLDALATGREVHLWLAQPSHALWDNLNTLDNLRSVAHLGTHPGSASFGSALLGSAPLGTHPGSALLGSAPLGKHPGSASSGSASFGSASSGLARDAALAPARGGPTVAGLKAPLQRDLDPSAGRVHNPLLASLGRDSRELQIQLTRLTTIGTDTYHPPLQSLPTSALGRLQAAIANDEPFEQSQQMSAELEPGDRSISVHSCHGPARQVEILRDLITGLLADDPTLEPRDVLVMCPDIENYAPLVSAAFGLAPDTGAEPAATAPAMHPAHRLRVRLADRSLRQTNSLLSVVACLLEFADSRHTASELLDFVARPPVRARFDFSDDDLATLTDWVQRGGLRWGFHAADRTRFGIASMRENTWRSGLDRVLVGAALPEDGRFLDTALPLTGLDSSDIDLSGRFAELIRRLTTVTARLSHPQPLSAWVNTLIEALDLLTKVDGDDAWQSLQARGRLGTIVEQAGAVADTAVLNLADIRAVLANVVAGSPTRANFRTGHLTMCSLVPMRSVPHRVICILGLDDGQFPRRDQLDGDDALRQSPAVGDRNRRQEDRQLLLDAVLAAREHLVLLYSGADPRTNSPRPPAVPLGEILDAIDATSHLPDGARARSAIVTAHPLQGFDARNFVASPSPRERPLSFDPGAFKAAQRSRMSREPKPPFLHEPFAPVLAEQSSQIALNDLANLLVHPARGFLSQRLGVRLDHDETVVDDAVPVTLDGLATWGVRSRVMSDAIAHESVRAAEQIELRRGLLPPAELGQSVLRGTRDDITALTAALASFGVRGVTSADDGAGLGYTDVDVDIELSLPPRTTPTGVDSARSVHLVGTVTGVASSQLLRVHAGRIGPRHRMRIWIELLALAACGQLAAGAGAALFGRKPTGGGLVSIPITAPGAGSPEAARAELAFLVGLYLCGLQRPLPMPVGTGYTYAEALSRNVDAAEARASAARVWQKQDTFNAAIPGEGEDREYQLVYGPNSTLADLMAEDPWPDEHGAGWAPGETRRFGRLATRVWQPILGATQPGITL